MSVSLFGRKAVLGASVLSCCLVMFLCCSCIAFAAEDAFEEDYSGPSVRMEARKIFLPLDESDNGAENSTQQNEVTANSEILEHNGSKQMEDRAAPVTIAETQEVKTIEEKKALPEKKVSQKVISEKKGKVIKAVFNNDSGNFKAVFDLSDKADEATWFSLDKPERIVVDLRGSWSSHIRSLHHVKGGPVEKVIVGEHPKRFRIVFYLKDKKAADIKPEIIKKSKGMEVSF